MWFWVTSSWAAVAILVAFLHHRWRRGAAELSPETVAFLLRFENELAATQPDVGFRGLLPGRFACLLVVDGQETVVSLQHVFHHADGNDGAFTRTVATLIAEIREVGLEQVADRDFAAAAPLLMPQVRSRAWLEAQGSFGDSALVHTPLADGLVAVYVIDDPSSMVFLCRQHLQRWRKDPADIHNLARQNLAMRGGIPLPAEDQSLVLRSGDGFDAARVLLLDQEQALLVAMPDRDTLWVGPERGQDLAQLMATTEAAADAAAYPVSPQVYRLTGGRLEAVPSPR